VVRGRPGQALADRRLVRVEPGEDAREQGDGHDHHQRDGRAEDDAAAMIRTSEAVVLAAEKQAAR
jgi:hypothetical protein